MVVAGVSNGVTPLFEYFTGANQPITGGTDTTPYVKAVSVRVNLHLKYKSNAPDLKFTTAVALRNNR